MGYFCEYELFKGDFRVDLMRKRHKSLGGRLLIGCLSALLFFAVSCKEKSYSLADLLNGRWLTVAVDTTEFYSDIDLEQYALPKKKRSATVQVIVHTGYTTAFNSLTQTPDWVGYVLTDAETWGEHPRKGHFVPDPDAVEACATTRDYRGSGYDRGHMAPAADMKWSEQAMTESFYLSNICPQNRNLNAGDWKELEDKARQWARTYGAVAIVCGPVPDEGYTTIGEDCRVVVPKRFFKVFLRPNASYNATVNKGEKVGIEDVSVIGFLFNNEAGNRPLSYYAVSVDEVERVTGLNFFATLDNKTENAVERVCDPPDWDIK